MSPLVTGGKLGQALPGASVFDKQQLFRLPAPEDSRRQEGRLEVGSRELKAKILS